MFTFKLVGNLVSWKGTDKGASLTIEFLKVGTNGTTFKARESIAVFDMDLLQKNNSIALGSLITITGDAYTKKNYLGGGLIVERVELVVKNIEL